MPCPEPLRVHAHFDGDLGASESAEIARHVAVCPACGELTRELQSLRATMRNLPAPRAPAALRARIARALDAEDVATAAEDAATAAASAVGWGPARGPAAASRSRRRWRIGAYWQGALSGIFGSAVAALLAFVLLIPRTDALVDGLVNAHRQSLLPDRLIAVVSSDHHTVKPWFAGHADVSPIVADFAGDGFRLLGGRAEPLEDHRAAVVVYQHGAHVINVFSWPKGRGPAPHDSVRLGYRLAFWQAGDLEYCAISDTNWSELHTLVALLRRAGDGENAGRETAD